MLEEDERFKDLYIMLDRVDVHCTWVSQAVLDLLPEDLPDIPGGEIIRDPGMGVFCDNAMEAVMKLWPSPGGARQALFIRSAMTSLHHFGIVGIHDAGVAPDQLRLYRELVGTDGWTLRVYAMVECGERNTFCPEKVSAFKDGEGFLSVKSVKLFAGTLRLLLSSVVYPSLQSSLGKQKTNAYTRRSTWELGECYD